MINPDLFSPNTKAIQMRPLLHFTISLLLLSGLSLKAQTIGLESNVDTTQLFIRIQLDGQTHKMLIDNGAAKTIFFLTKEERSRFKKISESKVRDAYNRESSIYIIRKATLEIPEIQFKYKGSFASLEERPLTLQEYDVDGILGLDILSQMNYSIQFKTLMFSLDEADAFQNEDDWFALSMIQSEDQLQAIAIESISNKRQVRKDTFTIDLGYNQIACRQKRNDLGDVMGIKLGFTETVLGMKIDSSYFESMDLILGSLHVHNLPMANESRIESSLLGFQFFKAFNEIYFDNTSQTLWVKKIKSNVFSFDGETIFQDRVVAQYIAIEDIHLPRISIGSKVDANYYNSGYKILWPLTVFGAK